MRCSSCGKEIPGDSKFCEFCGNPIGEKSAKKIDWASENDKQKELDKIRQAQIEADKEMYRKKREEAREKRAIHAEEMREKRKAQAEAAKTKTKEISDKISEKGKDIGEKTKKNKKKVVLGGAVLAAVIVAFVVVSVVVGRSENKTWKSFVKAYDDENKEDMISLMIPKSQRTVLESYISENKIGIISRFYDHFGTKDISRLTISEQHKADDAMKSDFDFLLERMGVKVNYSDADVVTLSDGTKVFMYKSGSSWYILPDGDAYMTKVAVEEDDINARRIADAICSALSDDGIEKEMERFYSTNILLNEDFTYLPESFQNAMLASLGELPEPRNTRRGAIGFTIYIYDNNDAIVYAASDKHVDEWVIAPVTAVDPLYYTGEKHGDGDCESIDQVKSEFGYVKLVSSKSPILGYWQADDAGMYIGCDTLGENKQFMIFSTFYTVVYPMGGNDSISGENKKIYLTWEDEETDEPIFTFTVKDKDHINVDYIRGEDDRLSYEFTRSEIGDDVLNQYAGNWVEPSGGNYSVTADTQRKIAYMPEWGLDSYTGTPVSMYDGSNTIITMLPYQGNWEGLTDYASSYPYTFYYMELDGDKLEYWGTISGGDAYVEETLYKEGSKNLGAWAAVEAYTETINEQSDMGSYTCNLIYIDDDDIPECVCYDGVFIYVFTYRDGEVDFALKTIDGYQNMYYSKWSNYMKVTVYEAIDSEYLFFEVGNGDVYYVQADSSQTMEDDGEETVECDIDGEEVSQSEYQSYISTYDNLQDEVTLDYDSIEEAAEALLQ